MKDEKTKSQPLEERIESSLKITIAIVLIFFIVAIAIVLVSPRFIDSSWMSPSSSYQVQMYEEMDPHLYISNSSFGNYELQHVQHVFEGKTLFAYVSSDSFKINPAVGLESFVTQNGDKLKLTKKLLLLKEEEKSPGSFALYDPEIKEAFVYSTVEGNLENWAPAQEYEFVQSDRVENDEGYLYVKNPIEYLIKDIPTPLGKGFAYAPKGRPIADLAELTGPTFKFRSRKELIQQGEHIFAIEGCWYCHTDQTRTLVQDTVLNGSDSYPAPPSSANEYIYQEVTFPGTRRIGPDLSRVGVKRPSRDWHRSHFWSPKTISPGSIMPSYHHFFDDDPRGAPGVYVGVP